MKKLILMILILIVVCSVNAAAETTREFSLGIVEGANINDSIPSGKFRIITDEYNYKELYDLIEFNSTFGIDSSDYNFISSDLVLYSEINDFNWEDKYIGVGFKQVFLDNSQASNFIFNSDITAYSIPLSFKAEEKIGEFAVVINGSIFEGIYNMTVPGPNVESDFSGYSVDLGVEFKVNDLDLKLSYRQEDYSFASDNDVIGATSFNDDYKGIFLGVNF